jgi:thymidylate synthase ThyX
VLASCLFEASAASDSATRQVVAELDREERTELLRAVVGDRRNRRHRPGRGFEAASYRFEIVSDYGAFRDLQRHRILTCQWQTLSPDLGAEVPDELAEAGVEDRYRQALEISGEEFGRLAGAGRPELAPYALCLGYRIRYVLDLNAREAMQLIELRSGREGHPSYRAVAQAMYRAIAEVHPAIAGAMVHVDHSDEERLERILSEVRTHDKQVAAQAARPGSETPQDAG